MPRRAASHSKHPKVDERDAGSASTPLIFVDGTSGTGKTTAGLRPPNGTVMAIDVDDDIAWAADHASQFGLVRIRDANSRTVGLPGRRAASRRLGVGRLRSSTADDSLRWLTLLCRLAVSGTIGSAGSLSGRAAWDCHSDPGDPTRRAGTGEDGRWTWT
jgi:hypothetical protein